MKLKVEEWIYLVMILGFLIFMVVYKMTNEVEKEGMNPGPVEQSKSLMEVRVEATPIPASPLPKQPLKLKTSSSVPDPQEEALNKMGLTKDGGAKPDFSRM